MEAQQVSASLCAIRRFLAFLMTSRPAIFLLFCVAFVRCASAADVTIQGRSFYVNGTPFLPKGVDVSAFLYPPKLYAANRSAQMERRFWGTKELKIAKEKFGANIIRFHVSQAGLDPQSPLYDPLYLSQILESIALTRRSNFAVVIVMDAQQDDESEPMRCMPSARTVRAWRVLAPHLAQDPDVMLELFNEPCKPENPQTEAEWAASMQSLIDAVRKLRAKNILLLDGLDWARTTNGLYPLVHDAIPNRLALAVHPYLSEPWFVTQVQWRNHFGDSATKYPLIATEWNATPVAGCVGSSTPARALALVRYLEVLHVGLIGWGIDTRWGTLVKDHERFDLTDYLGFTGCTSYDRPPSDLGAGKLLASYPAD